MFLPWDNFIKQNGSKTLFFFILSRLSRVKNQTNQWHFYPYFIREPQTRSATNAPTWNNLPSRNVNNMTSHLADARNVIFVIRQIKEVWFTKFSCFISPPKQFHNFFVGNQTIHVFVFVCKKLNKTKQRNSKMFKRFFVHSSLVLASLNRNFLGSNFVFFNLFGFTCKKAERH